MVHVLGRLRSEQQKSMPGNTTIRAQNAELF